MECPYCHGGLEPGALVSGYGSYYLPKGVRWGFMTTSRKLKEAGGFLVGRPKAHYEAEAWYCRACNRLTIFDAKAR